MINVIKATEIMRKYCPETKLEIKNGADGLYLTESDIIWIGRDWHLGGLLHEITHAMLYKEDGRTGHDGVFADRLTQLVGEVFCDHISQEGKKVDHIGEANEKVKEPEVGDVWESPFVKYMVLISTEVYARCLVDDNGLEIRNIPTFYLKEKCKYLGKSKVSIKELFDVKD